MGLCQQWLASTILSQNHSILQKMSRLMKLCCSAVSSASLLATHCTITHTYCDSFVFFQSSLARKKASPYLVTQIAGLQAPNADEHAQCRVYTVSNMVSQSSILLLHLRLKILVLNVLRPLFCPVIVQAVISIGISPTVLPIQETCLSQNRILISRLTYISH